MLHKRINFDRFAAVKMYQVYREGNFVEKISEVLGRKLFFQSGNTAAILTIKLINDLFQDHLFLF